MPFQSLGREDSPEGGHSNLLQYFCLENPIPDRSLVATVKKSQHAQGPGCQVLLWIREKRGGEEKREKTIQSLQMSPRMTSLRQGSV